MVGLSTVLVTIRSSGMHAAEAFQWMTMPCKALPRALGTRPCKPHRCPPVLARTLDSSTLGIWLRIAGDVI
eukprot:m.1334875 g.1334875  ORF g.1334875 m.1334875 type:complete len:71 (-) comp24877_c0_seq4:1894-2106(-)